MESRTKPLKWYLNKRESRQGGWQFYVIYIKFLTKHKIWLKPSCHACNSTALNDNSHFKTMLFATNYIIGVQVQYHCSNAYVIYVLVLIHDSLQISFEILVYMVSVLLRIHLKTSASRFSETPLELIDLFASSYLRFPIDATQKNVNLTVSQGLEISIQI